MGERNARVPAVSGVLGSPGLDADDAPLASRSICTAAPRSNRLAPNASATAIISTSVHGDALVLPAADFGGAP